MHRDSVDAEMPAIDFRGYTLKVLSVCFLGTHVPLVAITVYALSMLSGGLAAHRDLLLVALAATLVGTALTLYIVYVMLQPLLRSVAAK